MSDHDYAVLMYRDGYEDGIHNVAPKYADEPEYAIGYAVGFDKCQPIMPLHMG